MTNEDRIGGYTRDEIRQMIENGQKIVAKLEHEGGREVVLHDPDHPEWPPHTIDEHGNPQFE